MNVAITADPRVANCMRVLLSSQCVWEQWAFCYILCRRNEGCGSLGDEQMSAAEGA